MKHRRARLILFIVALSLLTAVFGLGLSYNYWLQNIGKGGVFSGIAADGWTNKRADISLAELFGVGNTLTIQLATWRPGNAPLKTEVKASVCGEPRGLYLVGAGSKMNIPLRGVCEPRQIVLEVSDTFTASASDTRQLGVQVAGFSVHSKLGVPIVEPQRIIEIGVAVFIFLLLLCYPLPRGRGRYFTAVAAAVACVVMLKYAPFWDLSQPLWLWICLTSICLGACLALSYRADLVEGAFDAITSLPKGNIWIAIALVTIVGSGVILRFYGLDFGLPNNYHPDEVPKVNAILDMQARGSFDPNYFLHPSFLLYCTYFVHSIMEYLGVALDARTGTFLAGRIVSALAGSASIILLYAVGRRLYSVWTGLFAAALLAFYPLHVTCSRYLKEDSLLLFFVLLALLWTLKAVKEDKPGFLFLAAAAAGLSASTKYSGALTAGIVLAAPFLKSHSLIPDRKFSFYALLAIVVVPVLFIFGTPYSILNYKKFRHDFGFEQRHMMRGHTQAIDAWSQYWMYHFSKSVIPGMTFFDALIGTIGVGVLLWRRRIEDLLIVALVLVFYLPAEWVKAKPAPQPERYILPCLPFLALAGTEVVRLLWRSRIRVLAPLAALLLVALPAWRSLDLARDIKQDTRKQAEEWMIANLPKDSALYLDWQPYTAYFPEDAFKVDFIFRAGITDELALDALKTSGKKYLMLSSLFYDRYFKDPNGEYISKVRIRGVFNQVPIIKEFTAPSGTYGFHNPRLTLFSLAPEDFEKLTVEIKEKQAGTRAATSNEAKTVFRW